MENNKKLGIVICAMAKNEHDYLNEWCKYHLNIGFDNIFIFDNDDLNSKPACDSIEASIRNRVHFVDIRGQHRDYLQNSSYNKFYKENNKLFSWCAFIDIDEYIDGVKDVKAWLNKIPEEFDQVRIKWKLFGDDDIIKRDMSIPVYKFFKKPLTKPGNLINQAKSIIRGGVENLIISSVHFGSINKRENVAKSCLPSGKPCEGKIVVTSGYKDETIFLNHYMTKTLDEFVNQKFGRGDMVFADREITFGYFFQLNNKTPEKIAYLKSRGFTDDVINKAIDNHRLDNNLVNEGSFDLFKLLENNIKTVKQTPQSNTKDEDLFKALREGELNDRW